MATPPGQLTDNCGDVAMEDKDNSGTHKRISLSVSWIFHPPQPLFLFAALGMFTLLQLVILSLVAPMSLIDVTLRTGGLLGHRQDTAAPCIPSTIAAKTNDGITASALLPSFETPQVAGERSPKLDNEGQTHDESGSGLLSSSWAALPKHMRFSSSHQSTKVSLQDSSQAETDGSVAQSSGHDPVLGSRKLQGVNSSQAILHTNKRRFITAFGVTRRIEIAQPTQNGKESSEASNEGAILQRRGGSTDSINEETASVHQNSNRISLERDEGGGSSLDGQELSSEEQTTNDAPIRKEPQREATKTAKTFKPLSAKVKRKSQLLSLMREWTSPFSPTHDLDVAPLIESDPMVLQKRADELYEKWSDLYRLQDNMPPPKLEDQKEFVSSKSILAWAPHLEDCTARDQHRREMEAFALRPKLATQNVDEGNERAEMQGAGYPSWACTEAHEESRELNTCDSPQPPWVLGSDADNLPLTRTVQRDLWVRQFPRNCSDPSLKFLLVPWYHPAGHGIGSQLHLMTGALGLAYTTGRILVAHGFQRADHGACRAQGKGSSLDCYYFSMTSAGCYSRAMTEHMEGKSTVLHMGYHEMNTLLSRLSLQTAIVVYTKMYHVPYESSAVESWFKGEDIPMDAPFAMDGLVSPTYDLSKVSWWKAQSIRFLLRWPTPYLCHITNRARHEAYGREVALDVIRAEEGEKGVERVIPKKEMDLGAPTFSGGTPLQQTSPWRLEKEPHMPRPIISVHVRQGDKQREMALFGLNSYMKLAYKLRRIVPDVSKIWLSTEMQSVVESLRSYQDWKFYLTTGARQSGETSMFAYEQQYGLEEHVGSSFANLLLSSQCDFFLGVLGSNWNRLINELRMTNGRVKASYFTLNNGEF